MKVFILSFLACAAPGVFAATKPKANEYRAFNWYVESATKLCSTRADTRLPSARVISTIPTILSTLGLSIWMTHQTRFISLPVSAPTVSTTMVGAVILANPMVVDALESFLVACLIIASHFTLMASQRSSVLATTLPTEIRDRGRLWRIGGLRGF